MHRSGWLHSFLLYLKIAVSMHPITHIVELAGIKVAVDKDGNLLHSLDATNTSKLSIGGLELKHQPDCVGCGFECS